MRETVLLPVPMPPVSPITRVTPGEHSYSVRGPLDSPSAMTQFLPAAFAR